MSGADDSAKERSELASRLRQAREYLGISQEDAARVLGIPRPAMTLIESGARKVEAVELGKLAKLYDRSIDSLLTGTEENAAENEEVAFLARATKGLTKSDLDELVRFSDYLRNSTSSHKRGK